MTLINTRDGKFNESWLESLQHDPVHPTTWDHPRRHGPDRDTFFLLEDNIPSFVLCVAYHDVLPSTMNEILPWYKPYSISKEPKFAIFYSIFKTPYIRNPKHKGGWLILSAASYIKEQYPTIEHFTTMSPIPSLSKKFANREEATDGKVLAYLATRRDPVSAFHMRNGATLMRVIPSADNSGIRVDQSFGLMANYDYTSLVHTL